MALTCPVNLSNVDMGFTEFLDCASLNINYDQLGVATLSFIVVSVFSSPTPSNYQNLTFGGVNFNSLVTTGIEVRQIPGSLVYEHRYSMTGMGCR